MQTSVLAVTDVTHVTRHSHIDALRACAHARACSGYKEQCVTCVTSVTEAIAKPESRAIESVILALDLGTETGWSMRSVEGIIASGAATFRPGRYDGGGMRYLRFRGWLEEIRRNAARIDAIYFEEVRRHKGVDAAHVYGGFLATLTSWCEHRAIPYQGVPVATIKRFVTGCGNADKNAVTFAVKQRGFHPADHNEADAIALLLWALETRGGVI